MTNYYNGPATAKIIRQILKEAFPGFKFSVKSTKTRVDISWVDGPSEALVNPYVDFLEGSYFDGMIDYQGSRNHTMNGEPVRFCDFIFTRRDFSTAAQERAIIAAAKACGENEAEALETYKSGSLWRNHVLNQTYRERLHKVSDRATGLQSAIAQSIKFAGDDGYGANTVGDLTKPVAERKTSMGYPDKTPKADANATKIVPFPGRIPGRAG